ncbi:putative splicing endonuclease [Tieghemostelium lacteum]|uniref:Putative splicing endonuclease n=1 Tax=Tieghemostelium lacteum TaxID=361077 RepID=A0A151Z933_TIELA|nr:putative splicing endonuclease [Tieghemostelium lacteum]|eukprot:KYQ90443.1 putative splicing endonuclease [Tieghemostelium lacteum]
MDSSSLSIQEINKIEEDEKLLVQQWLKEDQFLPDDSLDKAIDYLKDKKHVWCHHYTVMKHLLIISEETEKVNNFVVKTAEDQLVQCLDCATKYHKVKKTTLQESEEYLQKESVELIKGALIIRDQERCIKNLEKYTLDYLHQLSVLLHEIFHQTELLENATLRNLFYSKLDEVVENYSLSFNNPAHKVSGIYILLFNERPTLREWAISNLPKMGKSVDSDQFQSVYPVMFTLFQFLQAHQLGKPTDTYFSSNINDIWFGLSLLIKDFNLTAFKNLVFMYFPNFLIVLLKELELLKDKVNDKYIECLLTIFNILKFEAWSYVGLTINAKSIVKHLLLLFNMSFDKEDLQKNILNLVSIILDYSEFPYEVVSIDDNDDEVTIIEQIPTAKSEKMDDDDVIMVDGFGQQKSVKEENKLLSDIIIEHILSRCLPDNKQCRSSVKTHAFEMLIDIQLKRFKDKSTPPPTERISEWGKRLVNYTVVKPFQGIEPNIQVIPKAIELINLILVRSAIQLRSGFQYLYHGNESLIQKVQSDPCTFWCSQIWSNLLMMPPKSIPYSTHNIIFKIHRIIGLLQIPAKYNTGGNLMSVPSIYQCLKEYQGLMTQYLTTYKMQWPFLISKSPMDTTIQLDITDSEMFVKSIFSFVISPCVAIRDSYKPLLMLKNKSDTITMAFKESFKKSPQDGLKGVLGTLRDVCLLLGVDKCSESIGSIFYYVNHLFYLLYHSMSSTYKLTYFQPYSDVFWSIIESVLSRRDCSDISEIKYLFEWWKSSFSFLSQYRYCSIRSSPLPSFILSQIQKESKFLFLSSEQYPQQIRNHLKVEKNSSGQISISTIDFLANFEELYDDIANVYGEEVTDDEFLTENISSSIIFNYNLWFKDFIYWYGLNDTYQLNWYESLIEILKQIKKYRIKQIDGIMTKVKLILDKPHKSIKEDVYAVLKKHYEQLDNMLKQADPVKPVVDSAPQQQVKVVFQEWQKHPSTSSSFSSSSSHNKPLPPSSSYSSSKHHSSNNNYNNNYNNNSSNNNNNNNNSGNGSLYRSAASSAVSIQKPLIPPSFSSKSTSFGSTSSSSNSGKYSGKDFSEILGDSGMDVFDSYYPTSKDPKDKKKTMLVDLPNLRNLGKSKTKLSENITQHLPKVENLYKIILTWQTDLSQVEKTQGLKSIPNTFDNLDEYIQIFEPLLLEEFKAQVYKSMEEQTYQPINVTVDDLMSESDFHICDFMIDANGSNEDILNEDMVLISKSIAGVKCEAFGKVEKREKREKKRGGGGGFRSFLKIRLYKKQGSDSKIFISNHLKIESSWTIQKITSLSTLGREYIALHSVGRTPLGSAIISPNLTSTSTTGHIPPYTLPPSLKNALSNDLNEGQWNALNSSLTPRGFTLIQGPPGTGKTKTIMALLASYLAVFNKGNEMKKDVKFANQVKILVCAPSNAAVDEIASRIIRCGILNEQGVPFNPSIVRIGNLIHIDPEVQQISLDRLLERELKVGGNQVSHEQNKLMDIKKKQEENEKKREKYSLKIQELTKLRQTSDDETISHKLTKLYNKKNRVNNDLNYTKETERKAYESVENSKRNMVTNLLKKAQIILSTLSSSGHDTINNCIKKFDLVIIDEAAQAVELSNLIPLKHDVQKCILVGDPNQLPPTTISKLSVQYQYEMSLFQRLKNCRLPVLILKTQYRMHPAISRFPSQHFYEDQLINGPNVQQYKQKFYSDPRFGPLAFYDITDSSEDQHRSHSLRNVQESNLVCLLIRDLIQKYSECTKMSIGVITPYKQQQKDIELRLKHHSFIEVNTIDGFQGREKDIIIFSCVRAHKGGSIGFLSDVRRMNVGLTRAKFSLIVIGHSNLLVQNPDWSKLINHIKKQSNSYFPIGSNDINKGIIPTYHLPQLIQNISSSSSTSSNSKSSLSNSTTTTSSSNSNNNNNNIDKNIVVKTETKSEETSVENRDVKKIKTEKHINDDELILSPTDLRNIINQEKTTVNRNDLEPNDLRILLDSEKDKLNKNKRKFEAN